MAKRARMKGKDIYVVYVNGHGASEWSMYPNRVTADAFAHDMKGKGVKIKKWICKVPLSLYPDWASMTEIDMELLTYYIQQNYPHCVGED